MLANTPFHDLFEMRYRLCDFLIDSDLPLPELAAAERPGDSDGAAFVFRISTGVPAADAEADWFHEWRYPDGEPWSAFARVDGGYLCRFAEVADFRICEDNRMITCSPEAGVPENTIAHIFLNQVMPIVLSASGDRMVLHASAVVVHDRAIAFLGHTGQGKSTLAGSFCFAGFPLLTDDFLAVTENGEAAMATPTYPGLRLWDDAATTVAGQAATFSAPHVAHYTEKKRISVSQLEFPFADRPVPIDRFYFLQDTAEANDAGPAITSMVRRDAVLELTRYSFHLDLWAGTAREDEFARAGRLATLVPCYRLSYPRVLDRLGSVREAVLKHTADH